MSFRILLCAVAFSALVSAPAFAQRVSDLPSAPSSMLGAGAAPAAKEAAGPQVQGIAAVVNDAAITSGDLRARLGLALLSAGLPSNAETQKRLLPMVLRSLIEEQIQLQEGKKSGITVSDDEVQAALSRIAEDNKIPGGDMIAFLRANKIPPATLKDQVKAGITWNKIVMRDVRPRIDIGEDEISAEIQRKRMNAGKQELLVSEIFLAVDKPEEEEDAKALAEKLVEQIRGGAVFGGAARQFSQGLGAATGGDLGWIQAGQLAGELDRALEGLGVGEIAGPIRSATGYHILGVREKRVVAVGDVKEMTVKLQQIFSPFTPQASKESLLEQARTIKQTVTDCAALTTLLPAQFPAWRWQDLGEVKLADAPAWLAEKVAFIPEGQGSEAMATDKGALMVFVCGRTVPEGGEDREAIRRAIGSEKMELQARRLLRDLRKNAYIDIRLNP